MTKAAPTMPEVGDHLSFWEKGGATVAWVAAVMLFLTVGWRFLAPVDPFGAVSLAPRGGAFLALVQVCLLAGLASALISFVFSMRLPDAGLFAASVGLLAAALRGANATALLLDSTSLNATQHRSLAVHFLWESMAWWTVILAALVGSALATRMRVRPERWEALKRGDGLTRIPAGLDWPILRNRLLRGMALRSMDARRGLHHLALTAGVGMAVLTFLITGMNHRATDHGQVCFVVAASVMIGGWCGHHWAPVRSAFWTILGVIPMALIAYGWAALRPVEAGLPPGIPASPFVRILPVQFVAAGTAAAVAITWYTTHATAEASAHTRSTRQAMKGSAS